VTERAEYAAWRTGLDILQRELEGRLTSTAPLQAAAPWRPWGWEGELHGSRPQLGDELYRRETREQAAAKRRALQRRWCLSPQMSPHLSSSKARRVPTPEIVRS
jgi:hypothetical protein